MKQPVWVVEDDPEIASRLVACLSRHGYETRWERRIEDVLPHLSDVGTGILVADPSPPGYGDLEVLRILQERAPGWRLVAHGRAASLEVSTTLAVAALRAGAAHYLNRPADPARFTAAIAEVLAGKHEIPRSVGTAMSAAASGAVAFPGGSRPIIGEHPSLQRLWKIVRRVAPTDSTVLLTGESGTGKELWARALHASSPRANRPFVPVNCGAIPEPLLESELFGHLKGAFTGATTARAGRLELAHGGTLFLDEIGDMTPALQVKLLRVLQEREFEPVGGTRTIRVDVRVIAATHQDLDRRVADGTFREDLYYRLNVVPLEIPPLRDRASDIPLLIRHFLSAVGGAKGADGTWLTESAIERLMTHEWPGNVRELENLVERMAILHGSDRIDVADLPAKYRGSAPRAPQPQVVGTVPTAYPLPEEGIDLRETIEQVEDDLIRQALQRAAGNKNRAAQMLRMNRTTLVEKLKRKSLAVA